MDFQLDRADQNDVAGLKQPRRGRDAVDRRQPADRPQVRAVGRHGNGAVDRPYGLIEDAQVATLAAADQGDGDEERPGDAAVGPVAQQSVRRPAARKWVARSDIQWHDVRVPCEQYR